MDTTTLVLAVDSSQVNTASTALDKMATSGTGAEAAASRLGKTAVTTGSAMASAAAGANKGALAFKSLAEAEAALGPAAAKQLQAAGAFNDTAAGANTAAAAVKSLGDQTQRTALTWQQFVGQRMGPAMKELMAQGVPHTEAHTQAIRQIAADWQAYKAAGVGAQTAVTAQTGATVAALNSMGNAVQQATSKLSTRGSGLSAMAAEANSAKAAVGALDRATTSLGATAYVDFNKVTTSLGAAAAKANEATQEVNRLATASERLGGLSTATTSFGAAVGPNTSLRAAVAQKDAENRAGIASDPRLAALFGGGATAANAMATAAASANKQVGALGQTSKLTGFQTQQLGYQINDFVVQVISGSNPMMALVQQGAQLQGTFGSIGGAVRAVLSLFTPFRVAMLAAAAAGGVFALAMARAESSLRGFNTIQAQLSSTGRKNLFSTEELRQFTRELSLAPGVSRDTAIQVIGELSKMHDVSGPIFKDLAKLSVDYAKATGTDVPTAAKTLAKAFSDPERGAKLLDDALGTLSSSQLLQIERMMKMNNLAGAQAILMQAVKTAIKGVNDEATTPLQKSISDLGNAWDKAMQDMDKSQGLRTLNELLGSTIKLFTWLIEHSDKIGGLGNVGLTMIPGMAPAAAANIAIDAAKNAMGLGEKPKNPTASGKVTDLSGKPIVPGAASALAGAPLGDDDIKRSLEAANSFRSQAGQIADLVLQRKGFQESLKATIQLYGAESEQAKKLRDAIAGVGERIQGLNQRPQQLADALLQASVKKTQMSLEAERNTVAFNQKYLQDVYQAGQISLTDFYEQKRQAIVRGTAAELTALNDEQKAVEAHLATTKRLSPRDLAKQGQDKARLKEIEDEKNKVSLAGSREVVSTNTAETNSYIGLSDQILQYRANLAELQGDELRAAQLRAQAASTQALILAKQSQGKPNAITPEEIARNSQLVELQIRLESAKRGVSAVNEVLSQEEDRIALAQQRGAITELDALKQTGEARAKVAESLELIVKQMEALAALNPFNLQIQLDTARARLELGKLQSQLNPLKDQIDGMLKNSFSSNFADVLNGKAGPLQAIKGFFNSVAENLNNVLAKKVGEQLFGEGGILGSAGSFISENLFGVKTNKTSPQALSTAEANLALIRLQSEGADPATASLARLSTAADQLTTAIGTRSAGPESLVPPVGTPENPLSPGDFARFDRAYSGEQATADLFKQAGRSGEDLAATNDKAAASVLRMAQAATQGGGALGLLPGIIQQILMSSMMSGKSGGLGGLLGLFGGGSTPSAFAPGGVASSGFGSGMAFGNMDLGLFLASGGYTGDIDPKKPAGIVHGKEYVFSAPAVKAMGVDTLESMHKAAKQGTFSMANIMTQHLAGNRELGGPISPNKLYRINERGPEVLSVNGQHYLMSGKDNGEVKPASPQKNGNTTIVQVNVTPPAGGSRETAMQWGTTAGRHIQRSLRRNG